MKISIATFNVENLFTRFNFAAFENPRDRDYLPPVVNFLADFEDRTPESFNKFRGLMETATLVESDEKRQHTALALSEADADIVCMQEVDGIAALRKFQEYYLKKVSSQKYYQSALHEGNDFRGIDNAVMAVEEVSDKPLLMYTRSNAHMRISHLGTKAQVDQLAEIYPAIGKKGESGKRLIDDRGARIFARDCLEVDIHIDGKVLTLLVCHFKSMSGGGQKDTVARRQLEALAVKSIIERRLATNPNTNWLVLGDLNDYRQQIKISTVQKPDGSYAETVKVWHGTAGFTSGLDPLLDGGFGHSLVDALPELERWTHFYSGDRTKTQLDQMIGSASVLNALVGVPRIIRGGQPIRVPNTSGAARYPRVGWDRPKASDHCPVVAVLDVAKLL